MPDWVSWVVIVGSAAWLGWSSSDHWDPEQRAELVSRRQGNRMRVAPLGALVTLYYDDPATPPEDGQVVRTATGRSYRIVEARPVRQGVNAGRRWYLRCVVIDPNAIGLMETVHRLNWYRRTSRGRGGRKG